MTSTALFIAKNWPEPTSTAAGRRTLDLFDILRAGGYDIHVASPADRTPFQHQDERWTCHTIQLNHPSFQPWLKGLNPTLVVYDRFVMEEQFGWRVKEAVPQAMTLLDTSDLHCLRIARERAFKKQETENLFNDIALREISAIVRCDLTLMISQVEIDLLVHRFGVNANKLCYLPFVVDKPPTPSQSSYVDRHHLMMIGGFKHTPNRDATTWLRQEIWPALRPKLPLGTELHVYGAYADHAMNQLNNPKQGFHIKGRAENALNLMHQYRINLAPLRFGAGQKGKIFEGWICGIPTITTPIGAESMATAEELGYALTNNVDNYTDIVAQCYLDSDLWHQYQRNGYQIIQTHFLSSMYRSTLLTTFENTIERLTSIREQDFWQQLLWQQQFAAQKYMSRWIEVKNARNA